VDGLTVDGPEELKAKFHYASWFGDGSEPASVMEFGFNCHGASVSSRRLAINCDPLRVVSRSRHP